MGAGSSASPVDSDRRGSGGNRFSSVWSLILTNLATIGIAVAFQWDVRILVWGYWFQSVIIGLFNLLNIILLESFDTEDLRINGKPVTSKAGVKRFVALFFFFHYGLFHFVYFIFLLINSFIGYAHFRQAVYAALLFFVNSLFTFIKNRPIYSHNQNIGTLLFFPYARILPLHIIIILGLSQHQWAPALTSVSWGGNPLLLLFLLLKTGADTVMHFAEMAIVKRGTLQAAKTSV